MVHTCWCLMPLSSLFVLTVFRRCDLNCLGVRSHSDGESTDDALIQIKWVESCGSDGGRGGGESDDASRDNLGDGDPVFRDDPVDIASRGRCPGQCDGRGTCWGELDALWRTSWY